MIAKERAFLDSSWDECTVSLVPVAGKKSGEKVKEKDEDKDK